MLVSCPTLFNEVHRQFTRALCPEINNERLASHQLTGQRSATFFPIGNDTALIRCSITINIIFYITSRIFNSSTNACTGGVVVSIVGSRCICAVKINLNNVETSRSCGVCNRQRVAICGNGFVGNGQRLRTACIGNHEILVCTTLKGLIQNVGRITPRTTRVLTTSALTSWTLNRLFGKHVVTTEPLIGPVTTRVFTISLVRIIHAVRRTRIINRNS